MLAMADSLAGDGKLKAVGVDARGKRFAKQSNLSAQDKRWDSIESLVEKEWGQKEK